MDELRRALLPLPNTFGGSLTVQQALSIRHWLLCEKSLSMAVPVSLDDPLRWLTGEAPTSVAYSLTALRFRRERMGMNANSRDGWAGSWDVALCDNLPRTWVAGPERLAEVFR